MGKKGEIKRKKYFENNKNKKTCPNFWSTGKALFLKKFIFVNVK